MHNVADNVRFQATNSLLGLTQMVSDEITIVLLESLKSSTLWNIREDSARFIGRLGKGNEQNIQALYQGLLDARHYVRIACMQGLVVLARRFPNVYQTVEKMLIQAIEQPEFDKQDNVKRSAHDYAYEGLWLLVVGSEIEGEEE